MNQQLMVCNLKLFLSYAWSSLEHENWVIELATELVRNGIDVVFDKWDLKEGHNVYAFMERSVSDPTITKVVLVCDRNYAEKADGRAGGVGVETEIITPAIFGQSQQQKFVAVIKEKDSNGVAYQPTYTKGRVWIDLSTSEMRASNFDKLLRWVYDQPLHVKPKIGAAPKFTGQAVDGSKSATVPPGPAVGALRIAAPYALSVTRQFFTDVIEEISNLKLQSSTFDDEATYEVIVQSKQLRSDISAVVSEIASSRVDEDAYHIVLDFFEKLATLTHRPKNEIQRNTTDSDHCRFFFLENFLLITAFLLRSKRFTQLASILRAEFLNTSYTKQLFPTVKYYEVDIEINALFIRNQRLNTNLISPVGELLKIRADNNMSFGHLMDADLVLAINSRAQTTDWGAWMPQTLAYQYEIAGPTNTFARCVSLNFLERIRPLFRINYCDELRPLIEKIKATRTLPDYGYRGLDLDRLTCLDKIGSRP